MFFIYASLYVVALFSKKLDIEAANSLYLYDKNTEIFSTNNKDWIKLEDISPHLINATVSIEDRHFFSHIGFDYLRILKALYINFINNKTLEGASTITQQYAKNLFLDFDKKWMRKIEEAWLTIKIESRYDKNSILEGYLNTINYGGIFGIENASKYYFNKSAKYLTLSEASILAGIPKGPTIYSPFVNEKSARDRQLLILNSMVRNGYINTQERDYAYDSKLVYSTSDSEKSLTTIMYYQDAVINELKSIKSIPSSFLKTGGLKVYTNLDKNAQKIMEESIHTHMKGANDLEVASIMVEASSGKIIALAGGKDFSKSQFNRVLYAKRQVGSTMKPILYYSALENGFTASTTFNSSKTTFTFGENKIYAPQNFGDKYPNKAISMATALAYSDNIFAVKTHLFLGEESLVDSAKRMGIKTSLLPIPSLALGSASIPMIDMVNAYTTLANEGNKIKPYLIEKVEDMDGNLLYEHKEVKENVLNKSVVFILNDLMSNCYSNDLIDYNYPTCISIASKLTKKYAIKTGSTDTDHLIYGFNRDIVMGVWTGYDDNRETTTSDGVYSKNIWADTMEKFLKDKKNNWYSIPKNVVGVLVNPITGKPANSDSKNKKIVYYIKGTEPYTDESELDSMIPTIKPE